LFYLRVYQASKWLARPDPLQLTRMKIARSRRE
jgi:hypothetical protein